MGISSSLCTLIMQLPSRRGKKQRPWADDVDKRTESRSPCTPWRMSPHPTSPVARSSCQVSSLPLPLQSRQVQERKLLRAARAMPYSPAIRDFRLTSCIDCCAACRGVDIIQATRAGTTDTRTTVGHVRSVRGRVENGRCRLRTSLDRCDCPVRGFVTRTDPSYGLRVEDGAGQDTLYAPTWMDSVRLVTSRLALVYRGKVAQAGSTKYE